MLTRIVLLLGIRKHILDDMKTGSAVRLGGLEKRLLGFDEVFGKLVLFVRESPSY